MNLKDDLVLSLSQAVEDVFSTMLGASIVPGELTFQYGAPDAHDGVLSLSAWPAVGPAPGVYPVRRHWLAGFAHKCS